MGGVHGARFADGRALPLFPMERGAGPRPWLWILRDATAHSGAMRLVLAVPLGVLQPAALPRQGPTQSAGGRDRNRVGRILRWDSRTDRIDAARAAPTDAPRRRRSVDACALRA